MLCENIFTGVNVRFDAVAVAFGDKCSDDILVGGGRLFCIDDMFTGRLGFLCTASNFSGGQNTVSKYGGANANENDNGRTRQPSSTCARA